MPDPSDKMNRAFAAQTKSPRVIETGRTPRPIAPVNKNHPRNAPPGSSFPKPQPTENAIPRAEDLLRNGYSDGNINVPPFAPPMDQPRERLTNFIPPSSPVGRVEQPPQPDFMREENTPRHDLGADYVRIDVPSRCLFYSFQDINIRKLTVPDLLKVSTALRLKNSSVLYDAIGNTIDVDVRQLCAADFRYLMFWHRINSYTKTTYDINWTSRYGNANKFTITNDNLVVNYIPLTYEEALAYKERGFAVPTTRDSEVYESAKLTPEQDELFTRGQYLDPEFPPIAARIAELKAKRHPYPTVQARIEYAETSIELWEDIAEFRSKTNFGVEEVLKLRDQHFKVDDWITKLEEAIAKSQSIDQEEFNQATVMLEAELADIKFKLAKFEPIVAEEQEVQVRFSPWNLFPDI